MISEYDNKALQAAIGQAEKSLKEGGIPIGAALLDADGNIVAVGHNNRVQKNDPTAHAETECIRQAGRRRDLNKSAVGTDDENARGLQVPMAMLAHLGHMLCMATTLSPCAMCTGTAVLHQIPRIVIGENKTFLGREDWLKAENTELVVVDSDRCKQLMADFIKERPELWNEDIGIPPSS